MVYRKDDFWSVVEEHQASIKQLIFDFPYPNMARPMDKLGASLKKFGVEIKGKVRVMATAQRKDYLVIEPKEKNEDLDEIVSYLSEVGAPVNIHLITGRKIKCFSQDNPITVNVMQEIANFRGEVKDGQIFDDRIYNGVTELLNTLKKINSPATLVG